MSARGTRARAPKRDLIEVLRGDLIPRRKRGQQYRVWINGVEATSTRLIEAEFAPVMMTVSKITDPLDSGVQRALRVTLEFESPRVVYLAKPKVKVKA